MATNVDALADRFPQVRARTERLWARPTPIVRRRLLATLARSTGSTSTAVSPTSVPVPMPTEFDWEAAAADYEVVGNVLNEQRDDFTFHPATAGPATGGLRQLFGDCWEWTSSAYQPYPGFSIADGAISEYNGKFMSGQQVLRGGCVFTPPGHTSSTYRNFFHPHTRWHASGIRLATGRQSVRQQRAARNLL
jgi:hypothetical protein